MDSRSQACLDSWYVFIHIFTISCIISLKEFLSGKLGLIKMSIYIFHEVLTVIELNCSNTSTHATIHSPAFSCQYGTVQLFFYVLGYLKWHCMPIFRQLNTVFDDLHVAELLIGPTKLKISTKQEVKNMTSCYFF